METNTTADNNQLDYPSDHYLKLRLQWMKDKLLGNIPLRAPHPFQWSDLKGHHWVVMINNLNFGHPENINWDALTEQDINNLDFERMDPEVTLSFLKKYPNQIKRCDIRPLFSFACKNLLYELMSQYDFPWDKFYTFIKEECLNNLSPIQGRGQIPGIEQLDYLGYVQLPELSDET